ncbi:MAG: hypothetical protein PUH12_00005, partial [Lachnospiraceae bacterium]|nr:hypothetical protein [Lachnospiraceae bacterium]
MYKGMKRALSILMAFTLLLGFMTIFQQKVEAKSDDRGGLTQWMKDNRPFNGGYYRVWNDMQSKNVPDWKNPQTRMDEITDEVDLVLAFYDNQLGYIDTEVMKGYVQTLHSRGKKVVGSMFVHLLYDDIIQYNKNLENEIKADFKEYVQYNYSAAREVLVFPKNEAGNQARADFFLKYYMDLYGFDGLDIDMEKSEQEIGNNMDHVHTMFNLLAKKVGPKNNSDKLFIYDTTFSAEHSAFRNNKDLFDLVLIQKYGHHSEYRLHYGKSHFDTFAKYIPTENILIGFSFYEENTYASKGNNAHTNRWYDIPMRDGRVEKLDNNELTGKFEAGEFKDSRAGRYAKWQPDYGLKGGIFSYAVERDGVPHPTREEAVRMFEEYSKNKIGANYDIEKWVKDGRPGKSPSDDLDSTTYAQTKELNTLLEEDNFYGAIDETVIKDPAFREQVISHVGNYRGSIERYTKELYLNDANIESLEGLKEFKRVKSIQLYGLNKIKSITPDLLPDHFKIAPEEVF